MELGKDYYWRVDQVDTSSVLHKGDVWSFDIDNYIYVDSFDYADAPITDTWTNNGIVSLTLGDTDDFISAEFNNGGSMVRVPPLSDFTRDSVASMRIRYRAQSDVSGLNLYVTLDDGSQSATLTKNIVYADDDWENWNIDLSDFTGIDLTSIGSIKLGSTTGSGTVDITGIRLYIQRCVGDFAPVGDLNGDCKVDFEDHTLIANAWLESGYGVAPQPVSVDPVLWYEFNFDENILDSSGNEYDGEASDGWGPIFPTYKTGYVGDCVHLNTGVEIVVPAAAFATVQNQMTISCWVQADTGEYYEGSQPDNLFFNAATTDQPHWIHSRLPWTQSSWAPMGVYFAVADETATWTTEDDPAIQPSDWEGQWHHWAFVYDATDGIHKIYHNGELVESNSGVSLPINGASITDFVIGKGASSQQGYMAKVDEFKLFDKALSHEEILTLADATGSYVPVAYPEFDLLEDDVIDIRDYAELANTWLDEILWP